jgi:phosphate-selective porin OprO and OprP
MPRSNARYFRGSIPLGVALWVLLGAGVVRAQQPSPPQEPFSGANLPQPIPPQPTLPAGATTAREAQLESRIQQLEAMVNQLQYQYNNGPAAAGGPAEGPGFSASYGPGAESGVQEGPLGPGGRSGTGVGTGGLVGSRSGGPGVPGQSFPPVPPVSPRFNVPASLDDIKAHVRFGPGFEIASDDEEWIMQFHDLTQFDYRGYLTGGQNPTHDTFIFPRQWWMWNGHVTREIGYFVSIAQGIDTLNGLDIFLDFNYDRRLQFRAGRFKTPFTYEFFVEPVQGLIVPERSVFFNNFGQNRDEGIMPYGQLFTNDKGVSKIQYAAGIFNGNRNGFISAQDGKWMSAFLNFHMFGDYEGSILENLNVGGSVLAGGNSQTPVPAVFRTIQATTGNAAVGNPFLTLSDKAFESGPMAFWDLHVAWFYQQLAVISEWQSGYQDYSLNTNAATKSMRTHVPVGSFYVEAGYLLTGETRSQVGIVKPNNPFSIRPGQRGLGAWEVFGRYDYLDIGDQIFTHGIASPSGNANRLFMTDVGLTWHMTQYVKTFFDWNHVEYNNAVTLNPVTHKTGTQNNTLWWRLQLFF